MQIKKISVNNNSFIGLFFRASDSLLLCSKNLPHKLVNLVEETLSTPSLSLFIHQSSLVGVFTALNKSGCILPSFAEKPEISLLKKQGLSIFLLKGFSPGNNILANDKAALLNPNIPKKEARQVGDCLSVEVFQQPFSNTPTISSYNVVTNKGLLAYNEITETELKRMEVIFKVKAIKGTSNLGTPFNALGVVANSFGAVVGEMTSGFEVQRITEALEGG